MRRIRRTRAFVAGVVITAMLLSVTVLFGAQGSAVRVTSPAAKAKVSGVITVRAEIATSSTVSYALLVVDNDRPASTNAFPCSFQVDTRELSDGPHKIVVEAYDEGGLLAASRIVTIYVKNRPGAEVVAKRPAPTRTARASARAKKTAALPPAKSVAGRTGSRLRIVTEPAAATTAPSAAGPAAMVPVLPPKTIAGVTPDVTPRLAAATEGTASAATPGQTAIGLGPTPEPTHSASAATISPRRTDLAAATSAPGVAASALASVPPALPARPEGYRGRTLIVNGRTVEFDVLATRKAGRLQGGFRVLFTKLGARVDWLPKTHTAVAVLGDTTVEVAQGSRIARLNGRAVDLGAPAEVRNGRTIIPLEFFAEASGATVIAWDRRTGVAHLSVAPKVVARNEP